MIQTLLQAGPSGASEPAVADPEPSETGADAGEKAEEFDLTDAYTPPAHVGTGAVYSNAYRKTMSLTKDKEKAKADARMASAIFQKHGKVTPKLCGKFNAQPRGRKSSSPAEASEPANASAGNGSEP